MRVLYVISTAKRGGVETLARNLGRAAKEAGMDVAYLITHVWVDCPMLADYQALGPVVTGFNAEEPPDLPDCDFVHIFNNFGLVLPVVDLFGNSAPVLLSIHWSLKDLMRLRKTRELIAKLKKRRVKLATDTRDGAAEIGARYIPNFVDVEAFVPTKKTARSVLWTGRLTDAKGVPELLTTAVCVPDREFRVVAPAPTNEAQDRYRAALASRPNVTMASDLSDPDMAALFGESEWYLQTSRHEGTSLSLLQAMACGCECVASRAGNTAVALASGKAGHLWRVASPSVAIETLSQGPMGLGTAARARAEKAFSSPESFLRLYR